MYEKVNPSHPDKVADRIAGALVDLAYTVEDNPRVAIEVLIGHGECTIINETSVHFADGLVNHIVKRIAGDGIKLNYKEITQDKHLAKNQEKTLRCGDNGIFKGEPVSIVEKTLSSYVKWLYDKYPTDGKYLYDEKKNLMIICQSHAKTEELLATTKDLGITQVVINPLGDWTGGLNVDTGATNRKLGSDMGRAVTGGGLHGKDLSKADVAVNIYAHIKAQELGRTVEFSCAIGDETIDGKSYSDIVEIARDYINNLGGFEKLAEWGLI